MKHEETAQVPLPPIFQTQPQLFFPEVCLTTNKTDMDILHSEEDSTEQLMENKVRTNGDSIILRQRTILRQSRDR